MTIKQEGIARRKKFIESIKKGSKALKKGFGKGLNRMSKAMESMPSRNEHGITMMGALRSLKPTKRK